MKFLVLIAFVAVIGLACARPGEKYTVKYDGVDLDEILPNERLLKGYYNCLVDPKATCTPDGQELKDHLADALQTECSKCSEKQKEGAKKVIEYLIEHYPKWWETLQAKYDPEGIYLKKYKPLAEKEGVKLPS